MNIASTAPAAEMKTPYSELGPVAIERQFRRGVQLFGVRDLNLPTTTKDFTYVIADANGNQTGTYTTRFTSGNGQRNAVASIRTKMA